MQGHADRATLVVACVGWHWECYAVERARRRLLCLNQSPDSLEGAHVAGVFRMRYQRLTAAPCLTLLCSGSLNSNFKMTSGHGKHS